MSLGAHFRGLRARLLLMVLVVTTASAGVAAWSSSRSASDALVTSTEQRLIQVTSSRISESAPQVSVAPDQGQLDALRNAVGPDTLVVAGGRTSSAGRINALVSGALRTGVDREQRLLTQRVRVNGVPWLVIGTPVLTTAIDGSRSPSGVEVFTATDLSQVDRTINDLAWNASAAASLALPFAALLALLAATSVLRPVRRLRDTARTLAGGDLSARSMPRGDDELADLTLTVNAMADAVQRMHADARRFTADASHELRTPLSTLTAVMEVLESTATRMEPDAQESAQLAVAETRRLVRLVDDLMEVSRFDAGTAVLRLEEIDVAAQARETLRARRLANLVNVTSAGDARAYIDGRRLDLIIANLVGNALRHGRPPVQLAVSPDGAFVSLRVEDAGDGIPEDALPHVFDRFWKADGARTRSEGSGLGLSLALENARLHGGTLTAQNTPGGGARFVLRLPKAPHPPEGPQRPLEDR